MWYSTQNRSILDLKKKTTTQNQNVTDETVVCIEFKRLACLCPNHICNILLLLLFFRRAPIPAVCELPLAYHARDSQRSNS